MEIAVSGAILFDRDKVERLDDLSERPRLRGSKLLWVEVERGSDESVDAAAEAFGLDKATRDHLADASDHAVFRDHGRYIHVTTYSPCEEESELVAVECVVGHNWVITAHDRPVPVLEEFEERVSGSGDTGSLDGPGFVATLLEWVLGAYSAAFEDIEQQLEEFDVHAMRGQGNADDDIELLIKMRQEVGVLRRALAGHRSALVALTHPELEALGDHDSGARFESLLARFESTVQEARDAREAIVGSFDVLIARTGHRTNEIMKVLTLASVILLPGALVAGVMGMNFKVGLFEHTWLFWVVVTTILAASTITVVVARARRWF